MRFSCSLKSWNIKTDRSRKNQTTPLNNWRRSFVNFNLLMNSSSPTLPVSTTLKFANCRTLCRMRFLLPHSRRKRVNKRPNNSLIRFETKHWIKRIFGRKRRRSFNNSRLRPRGFILRVKPRSSVSWVLLKRS